MVLAEYMKHDSSKKQRKATSFQTGEPKPSAISGALCVCAVAVQGRGEMPNHTPTHLMLPADNADAIANDFLGSEEQS